MTLALPSALPRFPKTALLLPPCPQVLLKLQGIGVDFLRLTTSAAAKTHPRLAAHILHPGAVDTPAALEQRLAAARVVATTCLSAVAPALARQEFDMCIVDEASQARAAAPLPVSAC